MRFAFLSDPEWRRSVLLDGFGKGFWGFLAAAVVTGLACYLIRGETAFARALGHDGKLLTSLLPRVALALTIAALIWFILPRDRISALVGKESGIRGLAVSTFAGAVTPGGPSSGYALLAVLGASGADRGAMVAYIVSWATLGLQRILVWDVPFMGADFAYLRFFVSLSLPIVAGLIARRLPFALTLREERLQGEVRP